MADVDMTDAPAAAAAAAAAVVPKKKGGPSAEGEAKKRFEVKKVGSPSGPAGVGGKPAHSLDLPSGTQ